METRNSTIIADSSGLISLLIDTDQNHARAVEIAEALSAEARSVVIPSEVLAESLNIVGKKYGHGLAVQFVEALLESTVFVVKPSSDIARQDALAVFRSVTSSVSYTDCLVMSMAAELGTVDIFGFDEIFARRGFFMPTGPVKVA